MCIEDVRGEKVSRQAIVKQGLVCIQGRGGICWPFQHGSQCYLLIEQCLFFCP